MDTGLSTLVNCTLDCVEAGWPRAVTHLPAAKYALEEFNPNHVGKYDREVLRFLSFPHPRSFTEGCKQLIDTMACTHVFDPERRQARWNEQIALFPEVILGLQQIRSLFRSPIDPLSRGNGSPDLFAGIDREFARP